MPKWFLALLLCLLPLPADAGRGADGRFEKRDSSHFVLLQDVDIDRYSGVRGSRQFEIDVLRVLEAAYDEIGDSIGIRPRTKVSVAVYDPDMFETEFGGLFGFRVAGFYNGMIHVRGGTRVDGRLVSTLHHEYLHAALAWEAKGLFPAWLNEGLAEYFGARAVGRRYLSAGEHAYLAQAASNGSWIPLSALSTPSFSHLGGNSASLAYRESHALVIHLVRKKGMRELRHMCETLVKSRNVERALARSYRKSLGEIEQDLLRELH